MSRQLAGTRTAGMIADVDAAPPTRRGTRSGDVDAVPTEGGAEPGEVAPQRLTSRVAPITRTAPSRRLRPGDLICGQCGEGNPPVRRFCSRCGTELVDALVVKPRWWQRLLRRRGPRTAEAGTRPGRAGARAAPQARFKGFYRKLRAGIAVLMGAAAMLYLLVPPLRGEVNDLFGSPVSEARGRVERTINPEFVPVRPVERTATSRKRGFGGHLAVDQGNNTWWLAPWDPKRQPKLTLTFREPVDLDRLIVISGAAEKFISTHRPAQLHLVYSTRRSDTVTVKDVAEPQPLVLKNAQGVRTVEITVRDIYQAKNSKNVAVTEFEFFTQK